MGERFVEAVLRNLHFAIVNTIEVPHPALVKFPRSQFFRGFLSCPLLFGDLELGLYRSDNCLGDFVL